MFEAGSWWVMDFNYTAMGRETSVTSATPIVRVAFEDFDFVTLHVWVGINRWKAEERWDSAVWSVEQAPHPKPSGEIVFCLDVVAQGFVVNKNQIKHAVPAPWAQEIPVYQGDMGEVGEDQ